MTVEDLITYGKQYCHSDHVKLLLSELLGKNVLELLTCLDEVVDEDLVIIYKKEIEALKTGKPLQYVIGNVNFYGNKFIINKNVLIPRFETEELVENTIKYIKQRFNSNLKILDIGCGSGVIGLTLKQKFPQATVDLVDISPKAIEVAKENSKNLELDVNFIESDVFQNIYDRYDVIISNPPYIKTNEEIEKIVKDNEPHIALYGGEEGLDIYKKILKDIKYHLNKRFFIAFEIGYTQKESLLSLIKQYLTGVNIEVKQDLSNKDRMIFISNNE